MKQIPLDERICPLCSGNKTENETRLLLDCQRYSPMRDIFLSNFFFLKSEAFTFYSASLIEFIQLWPEKLQHIESPFCLLHLIDEWFLFSVFSIAKFLFIIFFFRFSIMCRRLFNKTIILLGLARWIWNDHNQLSATHLGYVSFHIQRAHVE